MSLINPVPGCYTADTMPDGATLLGEDYLFIVYHDPDKGCDPTIRNPTRGFHIESTNLQGLFEVVIPKMLLEGACGHIQFDKQDRTNGGLHPLNFIYFIYNTEIDCYPAVVSPPPIDTPPGVQVADGGSTLLMLALVAACLWRMR